MHSRFKQYGLFLSTVVTLMGMASFPAYATSLAHERQLMSQLQQQANQTYSEISTERAKANELTHSLSSTKDSLQNVDYAINTNQIQVRSVVDEIHRLDVEMAQNQTRLNEDKGQLVGQLRSMYEVGPVQYLNVLFGAKSFHDFLSRLTLLEMVATRQHQLIGEVNALQAKVMQTKVQRTSAYHSLIQRRAQLQTFQAAQQILLNRQQNLLADVNTAVAASTRRSVLLESQITLTQQQITQIEQETTQADQLMQNKSYVQQQQAKLANASATSVLSYAENFMGVPYVWGGTSPSGFDCSGFVQYVFEHFGVQLNRTSEEQYAEGVPVESSQLQPGDLVFFSTYAPGATHVGIYMGNGMMIDAEDRGVTIDNVFNSYWGPKYIGARQVLQ